MFTARNDITQTPRTSRVGLLEQLKTRKLDTDRIISKYQVLLNVKESEFNKTRM